jgi:hypothetical protein
LLTRGLIAYAENDQSSLSQCNGFTRRLPVCQD